MSYVDHVCRHTKCLSMFMLAQITEYSLRMVGSAVTSLCADN